MVSARKDNKRKKGETPLLQIKNKIKILKWVYCIMEEAIILLIETSKRTWWVGGWGGGGVKGLSMRGPILDFVYFLQERKQEVSIHIWILQPFVLQLWNACSLYGRSSEKSHLMGPLG